MIIIETTDTNIKTCKRVDVESLQGSSIFGTLRNLREIVGGSIEVIHCDIPNRNEKGHMIINAYSKLNGSKFNRIATHFMDWKYRRNGDFVMGTAVIMTKQEYDWFNRN